MRRAVRGQPPVELVEAAARPHCGDGRGELHALGRGVVHVVGREDRQPALGGEGGEQVVVAGVGGVSVVDELDVDRARAEAGDEQVESVGGRRGATGCQCLTHRALAAPGEHGPVPLGARGEVVEVVAGAALLAAGELRVRDRGGQAVISLLAAGEHEQVGALGVGRAAARRARRPRIIAQRQLGAEHRLHVQLFGGFGEADDPVEPVVIGDGEGVQPQPLGFLGELRRRRGPVEERVRRVRVQLGVGHGVVRAFDGRGLVLSALA